MPPGIREIEQTDAFIWLGGGWLVGWNDLVLFAIFENGHFAADQVYFYEFNSKKSANLPALMPIRQSFPFQKITGTLKMIFLNLEIPSFSSSLFSSKNNRQIEKIN